MIYTRLMWIFINRFILRFRLGVKSSIFSFVCKESRLARGVSILRASTVVSSKLGEYTYLANSKVGYTSVGSYCSIGPGARIGGLGAHPLDTLSSHPIFYQYNKGEKFIENKYTRLGSDVWVGANAIILDGVSIGDGAVVGAGSVVTKDVPDYAIVAGNPARIIRYRFSAELIYQIKQSQWHKLPLRKLIEVMNNSNSLNDILDKFNSK